MTNTTQAEQAQQQADSESFGNPEPEHRRDPFVVSGRIIDSCQSASI